MLAGFGLTAFVPAARAVFFAVDFLLSTLLLEAEVAAGDASRVLMNSSIILVSSSGTGLRQYENELKSVDDVSDDVCG